MQTGTGKDQRNLNLFSNCFVLFMAAFLASCLLTGCRTEYPTHPTAYDQIHQTLQQGIAANRHQTHMAQTWRVPGAVSHALLTDTTRSHESPGGSTEHRFDVTADGMPAKTFFMGLVAGTSTNMVVDPSVNGSITLNLKQVTVDEALSAVQDTYGYEYKKTAFGYEILPRKIQTAIFNINYLDLKRTGNSTTELSTGQISEILSGISSSGGFGSTQSTSQSTTTTPSGSSVKTDSTMDFWRELRSALTGMVGTSEGRSVIINPEAGMVTVRAYPNELHQVRRYLNRIQAHMRRQVILEAKILEVMLNDQFQAGIDWNVLGKGNPATNDGGMSQDGTVIFNKPIETDLADFNTIFTLNMGKGSFNLLVKLLQTQGNVQVLSSPRISTVNNQKAVIKVGSDEFYVTGVSTDNTVTANSTIPTQNVTLTPFFSGITFDVTPEISGDDAVILHIHPAISVVTQQNKDVTLGQSANNTPNTLVLPLAHSTIRESDNIVRARSGQVIVIGGLMQNKMVEQIAGVPGISRLPFFGTLFRRTFQVAEKSELVILLRPIVVNNSSAFTEDMETSERGFHRLKRGFHVGGLPEIFGNTGEREAP